MAKAAEIIKELGDTNWSKDNEAQMKAVQLLKGLAVSEEPISNEFMKHIDKATTNVANKVLGGDKMDESCSKDHKMKKETSCPNKKKQMNEEEYKECPNCGFKECPMDAKKCPECGHKFEMDENMALRMTTKKKTDKMTKKKMNENEEKDNVIIESANSWMGD